MQCAEISTITLKSRRTARIMQVQRLFVRALHGRSDDHLRHASFGTKRNFGRF
jgi:hypothetical protein